MKITPEVIRAAYTLVTTSEPFTLWACPPPDAMKFAVYRHRSHFGDYRDGTIWISEVTVQHLSTLLIFVAHEALHAVQQFDGTESPKTAHNADFRRRARMVCDAFGFDYGLF